MARRFSWRRATGYTATKGKLSHKIGMPLSRSGRRQKIRQMTGGGGSCVALLHIVGWIVMGWFIVKTLAGTPD